MAEISDEEFSSLLNNIYHKHYSKTKFETDITNMQQIAERFIQKITGIVKSMAITNMDVGQAEKFLLAQSKKRDSALTESQIQILLKFWTMHRVFIHDYVQQDSRWDSQLTNLTWRVDSISCWQQISSDVSNEPGALVNMSLTNESGVDFFQFELDNPGISMLLDAVKSIQSQMDKYVHSQ